MNAYYLIANDLALDFINTNFTGGDTLPNFAALVGWFEATQTVTPADARRVLDTTTKAAGTRVLAEAYALRATLRRVVEAHVADVAARASDVASINAHLSDVPLYHALAKAGRGLESVRRVTLDAPEALLYFPADAGRELLTRKDRAAIRRCANELCTHYFYDVSKNGTRRWCSMTACGNRDKVAASRKRRAG